MPACVAAPAGFFIVDRMQFAGAHKPDVAGSSPYSAIRIYMATRAKMICRHPGCNRLVDIAGYCELHSQDATGWFRTSKGNSSARGYGGRWRLLRRQVLERDSYLCCECGRAGRIAAASEVDHIVPKSQGGTDDLSNLQSLCPRCHRAKTQQESRGRVKSLGRLP